MRGTAVHTVKYHALIAHAAVWLGCYVIGCMLLVWIIVDETHTDHSPSRRACCKPQHLCARDGDTESIYIQHCSCLQWITVEARRHFLDVDAFNNSIVWHRYADRQFTAYQFQLPIRQAWLGLQA
eukprot:GHRR01003453.1.p1 GENE.GHRR01003453.1~~GHRR01003453.1.p1  ORF type:complete len:125 (-),score=22.84 GHRR01003453.1:1273-1647(-)